MRWVLLFAACWMLASATASSVAAEPAADEIQSWLAQLNDDDFARREQATERLQAAGDAAIEALAQGALSSSPEVAWRAGEALKRIAIDGNERTLDRVAAALERIGQHKSGGTSQVVAEIRARQRQIRRDRASVQIRRLGGQLSGGYEGAILGGGMVMPVAMPIVAIEEVPAIEAAAIEAAAAEVLDEAAADLPPADEPAVDLPDDLPKPPTDDLKAVIAEFFAAEPDRRAAAKEAAELEVAGIDDMPIRVGGIEVDVDDAPIDAIDLGFLDVAGGDALFAAAVEDAGGAAAQSLTLDANWRGGDKGLAVLRDLPEITQVSIRGAKLTDAAVAHLAALPRLGSLHIQGTKFSAGALRKLHRARPKVYMFCQGEAMLGIHADTTGSCVLTSVYPGSGAHDAGLLAGDKIVAIDHLEIRDFSELTISVYARGVGEKLKIEYERDGLRKTAQVELRARKVLEP